MRVGRWFTKPLACRGRCRKVKSDEALQGDFLPPQPEVERVASNSGTRRPYRGDEASITARKIDPMSKAVSPSGGLESLAQLEVENAP